MWSNSDYLTDNDIKLLDELDEEKLMYYLALKVRDDRSFFVKAIASMYQAIDTLFRNGRNDLAEMEATAIAATMLIDEKKTKKDGNKGFVKTLVNGLGKAKHFRTDDLIAKLSK